MSSSSRNSSFLSRELRINPEANQTTLKKQIQNGPKLIDLQKIKTFTSLTQPSLTNQKRRHIEQKLQMDKQVQKQLRNRLKQDNLFANYKYNPFIDVKQNQKHKHQIYKGEDIVTSINQLRQKLPMEIQISDRSKYQHLSAINMQIAPINSINHSKISKQRNQAQTQHSLSFQDIISLNEPNFYKSHMNEINLFRINLPSFSHYSSEMLKKYHFNNNSIKETYSKYSIPMIRDLSNISRHFSTGIKLQGVNRLDFVNPGQIQADNNNMRFQDLLNISSGRMVPQLIQKLYNEQNQSDHNSSEAQQTQQIIYNQSSKNQSMNCNTSSQDIRQIEEYLKLSASKADHLFNRKCMNIKDNIESELLRKEDIIIKTIKDRKVHTEIDNSINKDLQYFLQLGNTSNHSYDDVDRLIRNNKGSKSRNETIKLNKLLETLKLVKSYKNKNK